MNKIYGQIFNYMTTTSCFKCAGSWSCHLCIEEFYGGHKPEVFLTDDSEADS